MSKVFAARSIPHTVAGLAIAGLLALGGLPRSSAHAGSYEQSGAEKQQYRSTPQAMPSWIQEADPYVAVVHYTAVISPAITRHLGASDVAQVKAAVKAFNMLPLAVRDGAYISAFRRSIDLDSASQGPCRPGIDSFSFQWFGFQGHFNDCLVNILATGTAGAGLAASLLLALPGAGWGFAVIVGILGVETAAIMFQESQCHPTNGVWVHIPWIPAGLWPTKAC